MAAHLFTVNKKKNTWKRSMNIVLMSFLLTLTFFYLETSFFRLFLVEVEPVFPWTHVLSWKTNDIHMVLGKLHVFSSWVICPQGSCWKTLSSSCKITRCQALIINIKFHCRYTVWLNIFSQNLWNLTLKNAKRMKVKWLTEVFRETAKMTWKSWSDFSWFKCCV